MTFASLYSTSSIILAVLIAITVTCLIVVHCKRRKEETSSVEVEKEKGNAVRAGEASGKEESPPQEVRKEIPEEEEPSPSQFERMEDFSASKGGTASSFPEIEPLSEASPDNMMNAVTDEDTVEPLEEPLSAEETKGAAEKIPAEPTEKEESPDEEPLAELRETEQETPEFAQEVKRRRDPIARGGRPRGSTSSTSMRAKKPGKASHKPGVVCWNRSREWFIGLELPEVLADDDDLSVYQDEHQLSPDEFYDGCFKLVAPKGDILIKCGGREPFCFSVGREGYLLFKLSKVRDEERGRQVKSTSYGSYLIVVESGWSFEGTDLVPEEEPVVFEGYSAYSFKLDKGSKAIFAFVTPEGKRVTISPSCFELIGSTLPDAAESMGPLFNQLPRIHPRDPREWEKIKTIIVLEEGEGKGKWRGEIEPLPDRTEQELPREIEERKKEGWYSLRFYDENVDLVESLDFRFAAGLHRVEIPEQPPLPGVEGHESINIRFVHEPGFTIRPKKNRLKEGFLKEGERETVLTIPPSSEYDETCLQIGHGKRPKVQMILLVERVWWALGNEREEPSESEWVDKPIVLSREDFEATSEKALWLRFPKRRWADGVYIGFERSRRRPYSFMRETLVVPLREFTNAEAVENPKEEFHLKVWIERDKKEYEAVIGVLRAVRKAPPKKRWIGKGRYKSAKATATLQSGSGVFMVNGKPAEEHFQYTPPKGKAFLQRLCSFPEVRRLLSELEVSIEIKGSSPRTLRQAKAAAHALARAIMKYDTGLVIPLKRAGFGGVRVVEEGKKSRRNRR